MTMPAWSFSSLSAFETCPRQYQVMRVLKAVKEPETEAQRWGNEVHKALELRVKDGTPLPDTMQKWEPLAARLCASKGEVFAEQKYALTRNLTPTEFFAPDCWHRGIIDVQVLYPQRAFLGDYKTGKVKTDYDQLTLSAASLMAAQPQVESVKVQYLWLAHNKVTSKDVKRDEVPVIWQDFHARVHRLQLSYEKDKWLPKPSGLCNGWCPVGREHCQFWCPKKKK